MSCTQALISTLKSGVSLRLSAGGERCLLACTETKLTSVMVKYELTTPWKFDRRICKLLPLIDDAKSLFGSFVEVLKRGFSFHTKKP